MAKIKQTDNTKCQHECSTPGTLSSLFYKIKHTQPCNPALPLLDILLKRNKTHKDQFMNVYRSFIIAKTEAQFCYCVVI